MPRSKRSVRQSGLARSLGASGRRLILCLNCRRWLPRESIAKMAGDVPAGHEDAGKPIAFCGRCWPSVEREAIREVFKQVVKEELGIDLDEASAGG